MTYLDAAYTILKAAGQPLHFEAVSQCALLQKRIATHDLTSDATTGLRLYTKPGWKAPASRLLTREDFGPTQ